MQDTEIVDGREGGIMALNRRMLEATGSKSSGGLELLRMAGVDPASMMREPERPFTDRERNRAQASNAMAMARQYRDDLLQGRRSDVNPFAVGPALIEAGATRAFGQTVGAAVGGVSEQLAALAAFPGDVSNWIARQITGKTYGELADAAWASTIGGQAPGAVRMLFGRNMTREASMDDLFSNRVRAVGPNASDAEISAAIGEYDPYSAPGVARALGTAATQLATAIGLTALAPATGGATAPAAATAGASAVARLMAPMRLLWGSPGGRAYMAYMGGTQGIRQSNQYVRFNEREREGVRSWNEAVERLGLQDALGTLKAPDYSQAMDLGVSILGGVTAAGSELIGTGLSIGAARTIGSRLFGSFKGKAIEGGVGALVKEGLKRGLTAGALEGFEEMVDGYGQALITGMYDWTEEGGLAWAKRTGGRFDPLKVLANEAPELLYDFGIAFAVTFPLGFGGGVSSVRRRQNLHDAFTMALLRDRMAIEETGRNPGSADFIAARVVTETTASTDADRSLLGSVIDRLQEVMPEIGGVTEAQLNDPAWVSQFVQNFPILAVRLSEFDSLSRANLEWLTGSAARNRVPGSAARGRFLESLRSEVRRMVPEYMAGWYDKSATELQSLQRTLNEIGDRTDADAVAQRVLAYSRMQFITGVRAKIQDAWLNNEAISQETFGSWIRLTEEVEAIDLTGTADATETSPATARSASPEVIQLLQRAREANDVEAMLDLSARYESGDGVSANFAKSQYWFQAAIASSEDVEALTLLGKYHERRRDRPKDLEKARALYRKAADLGSAEAASLLANLDGDAAPAVGVPVGPRQVAAAVAPEAAAISEPIAEPISAPISEPAAIEAAPQPEAAVQAAPEAAPVDADLAAVQARLRRELGDETVTVAQVQPESAAERKLVQAAGKLGRSVKLITINRSAEGKAAWSGVSGFVSKDPGTIYVVRVPQVGNARVELQHYLSVLLHENAHGLVRDADAELMRRVDALMSRGMAMEIASRYELGGTRAEVQEELRVHTLTLGLQRVVALDAILAEGGPIAQIKARLQLLFSRAKILLTANERAKLLQDLLKDQVRLAKAQPAAAEAPAAVAAPVEAAPVEPAVVEAPAPPAAAPVAKPPRKAKAPPKAKPEPVVVAEGFSPANAYAINSLVQDGTNVEVMAGDRTVVLTQSSASRGTSVVERRGKVMLLEGASALEVSGYRPQASPVTGKAKPKAQAAKTPLAVESSPLSKQQRLTVEFRGKTYEVGSIQEAAIKWKEFVGENDLGVSQVGNGLTVKDETGKVVGRISYNGRMWDAEGNELPGAPADTALPAKPVKAKAAKVALPAKPVAKAQPVPAGDADSLRVVQTTSELPTKYMTAQGSTMEGSRDVELPARSEAAAPVKKLKDPQIQSLLVKTHLGDNYKGEKSFAKRWGIRIEGGKMIATDGSLVSVVEGEWAKDGIYEIGPYGVLVESDGSWTDKKDGTSRTLLHAPSIVLIDNIMAGGKAKAKTPTVVEIDVAAEFSRFAEVAAASPKADWLDSAVVVKLRKDGRLGYASAINVEPFIKGKQPTPIGYAERGMGTDPAAASVSVKANDFMATLRLHAAAGAKTATLKIWGESNPIVIESPRVRTAMMPMTHGVEFLRGQGIRFLRERTDAQLSADHAAAFARGDMETAQKLVDEAAAASGMMFRGHKRGRPQGSTETFVSQSREQAQRFANQHSDGVVSLVRFTKPLRVYEREIGWQEYQDSWRNSVLLKGYDAVRVVEPNGQDTSLAIRNPAAMEFESAEPVTRDTLGNLIPLDKRFDKSTTDVRFLREKLPVAQVRSWLEGLKPPSDKMDRMATNWLWEYSVLEKSIKALRRQINLPDDLDAAELFQIAPGKRFLMITDMVTQEVEPMRRIAEALADREKTSAVKVMDLVQEYAFVVHAQDVMRLFEGRVTDEMLDKLQERARAAATDLDTDPDLLFDLMVAEITSLGIRMEDAVARQQELEARFAADPSWMDLVKRLREINRKTMDMRVEAGLVTQAAYDTVLKRYPNYVPVVRSLFSPEVSDDKAEKTGNQRAKAMRVMKGPQLAAKEDLRSFWAGSFALAQYDRMQVANQLPINRADNALLRLSLGEDARLKNKETNQIPVPENQGIPLVTPFFVSEHMRAVAKAANRRFRPPEALEGESDAKYKARSEQERAKFVERAMTNAQNAIRERQQGENADLRRLKLEEDLDRTPGGREAALAAAQAAEEAGDASEAARIRATIRVIPKGTLVHYQINDPVLAQAMLVRRETALERARTDESRPVVRELAANWLRLMGFQRFAFVIASPNFLKGELMRSPQQVAIMASVLSDEYRLSPEQSNKFLYEIDRRLGGAIGGTTVWPLMPIFGAAKAIPWGSKWRSAKHVLQGGEARNEYEKLVRQAMEDGVLQGALYDVGTFEGQRRKVIEDLKRLDSATDSRAMAKVVQSGIDVTRWFDVMTNAVDFVNRMVMYEAAIAAGISRQKAAVMARDSTVDFGKKGVQARGLSQVYLFLSPRMQGINQLIRAFRSSTGDGLKASRRVLSKYFLWTLIVSLMREFLFEDDEDPQTLTSRFAQEQSMLLPLPWVEKDGRWWWLQINNPYGFGAIAKMSNAVAEMMAGDIGPGEALATTASSFLSELAPVTIENKLRAMSWAQAFVPTNLQPIADVMIGRDYKGSPIAPLGAQFGAGDLRASRRYFANTPYPYIWAAHTLADLTAPIYRAAMGPGTRGLELSPNEIQYVLERYMPGIVRNVVDGVSVINQQVEGTRRGIDQVPIVSSTIAQSGGRRVLPGLFRDYDAIARIVREDLRTDKPSEVRERHGELGIWLARSQTWKTANSQIKKLQEARNKAIERGDRVRAQLVEDRINEIRRRAVAAAMRVETRVAGGIGLDTQTRRAVFSRAMEARN